MRHLEQSKFWFALTRDIAHRGKEEPSELVLKIGDEEVDGWFTEKNFIGLISVYEKMALKLGRPNEKFFKKHTHLR